MTTRLTAEDFKNARFAEHENGRAAMRPQPGRLWHLGSVHMEDHEMAENGWRPVVEADHPARPLAGYRAQVKELREKVRDLERDPLTLDTLREAWENAEVPTDDAPIREGDVVIVRHGGGFTVEPADRILSGQTYGRERVLSRAPQREPWADANPQPRTITADEFEKAVRVLWSSNDGGTMESWGAQAQELLSTLGIEVEP